MNLLNKSLSTTYKIYSGLFYRKFHKKLDDPFKEQANLRLKLGITNQSISEYSDFEPRIAGGLTNEPVVAYELTSGSGGATKKIPYTKSLLKSFERMFIIWSYDVLKNIEFKSFKTYFSISPQFIDIDEGLGDDSEYLSGFTGIFTKPYFIHIPGIKNIKDPIEFKNKTCQAFIEHSDLEVISVWSPSFLLELIEHLEDRMGYRADSVFKNLKFVSAWGHANAEADFNKLKAILPQASFQKKGLLATEAPLTLPLMGSDLQIPLIDEVYFEFMDERKNLIDLSQVEINKTYEVVISQKSGLIRYRLKDLVKITGFYKKTPCFEFVARADKLTDLVGEKLHEIDVYNAIKGTGITHIAPDELSKRYIFFSEDELKASDVEKVEKKLRDNVHYHNARELGQLKDPVGKKVDKLGQKLSEIFAVEFKIKKGDQKIGPLLYKKPHQVISLLNATSSSP